MPPLYGGLDPCACAACHIHVRHDTMGWLRVVGSLKSYVSSAEYRLFNRALLQKRPIILRSLLIVATPCAKRAKYTVVFKLRVYICCVWVESHMKESWHSSVVYGSSHIWRSHGTHLWCMGRVTYERIMPFIQVSFHILRTGVGCRVWVWVWGLGLGVGFRVAYRHVPLEILMNSLLCILTGVGCGVQLGCGMQGLGVGMGRLRLVGSLKL